MVFAETEWQVDSKLNHLCGFVADDEADLACGAKSWWGKVSLIQ